MQDDDRHIDPSSALLKTQVSIYRDEDLKRTWNQLEQVPISDAGPASLLDGFHLVTEQKPPEALRRALVKGELSRAVLEKGRLCGLKELNRLLSPDCWKVF